MKFDEMRWAEMRDRERELIRVYLRRTYIGVLDEPVPAPWFDLLDQLAEERGLCSVSLPKDFG